MMPSGTQRSHHNVTPAATEREVNTQGRGTQGSVCACVNVCTRRALQLRPLQIYTAEMNVTRSERERER